MNTEIQNDFNIPDEIIKSLSSPEAILTSKNGLELSIVMASPQQLVFPCVAS